LLRQDEVRSVEFERVSRVTPVSTSAAQ
jgi:hypothetical protein